MSLKKKSIERMMFKTALGMVWLQIVSILLYFMMALVVQFVFADQFGEVKSIEKMIATIVTISIIYYTCYQRVWDLGEDHKARVDIGTSVNKKYIGIFTGLTAMSPVIICWILNLIVYAIKGYSTTFGTVTGYLLYPWDPYFEIVKSSITNVTWAANLFYLPVIALLPVVCHFGFINGMKGGYRGLRFKKKHYKPYKAMGE